MMKRIWNIMYHTVLITIIVVSSLYIISAAQTRINPEHIPSVLGFCPLTVVSGSMSPGINTGDMVVIKKGSQSIQQGDIVTYRLEDALVIHRVKAVDKQGAAEVFVTQGDANSIPDYKVVEHNQVVGKYLFRIPMGGYIKASLQGWPGILILGGLVLIGLMSRLLDISIAKVKQVEQGLGEF